MKTVNYFSACMIVLMLSVASTTNAQIGNLQIHKELGSFKINDSTKIKRDGFRAKFEMLGVDSLGTYYWNTQISYSTNDKSVGAQVQILRGLRFSKKIKLQALIGHSSAVGTTSQWYAGVHYPLQVGRVRMLPFFAYVFNKDQKSADFRFTSGVTTNLAKNKLLIFGFVNAYTKDRGVGDGSFTKEIGFQANPQLWLRFSKKIAVGSELNVDYLKSRYQQWIFIPTAGARWVF